MNRRFKLAAVALLAGASSVLAYNIVWVRTNGNVNLGAAPETVQHIGHASDSTGIAVKTGPSTVRQIPYAQMRDVRFGESDGSVVVRFGTSEGVLVENPKAFEGVDAEVTGDKVTLRVASSDKSLTCRVTGTTSDGQVKIYSDGPVKVILDNARITNGSGSAVNLQTTASAEVELVGTSTLCDSKKYSTPTGEDENATLFCANDLRISGKGKVSVTANKKHAICSKNGRITVADGTIDVLSSASTASASI